jgi:HEAT repeat protein
MTQDQYADTLTRADSHFLPASTPRWQRFARVLRHVATGLGFALLLTCLAALLWLLNPGHLLSSTSPHTLPTFLLLPVHVPALWLLPLAELALGTALSWLVAQPLALLAYLKDVRQHQEVYRARYTPLHSWSYPYDVPVQYSLDDPDPTQPRSTRTLTILKLIETMLDGSAAHLLLLGAPGAGKTYLLHEYLSAVTQRRRHAASGRLRIPLFFPLKYYALLYQTFEMTDPASLSLLDLLAACNLPGLDHLRPYLDRLFRQGRLLFLCDGLDEVPESYRPALERELGLLFRQNRNGLFLTCTRDLYQQTPDLIRSVGENLVPRAVLPSLEPLDARIVVERFITEMDAEYHPQLPTAGQVMTAIEQTRLRFICTAPLYLFALLALLETHPVEDLRAHDTRGRLLRASLQQRLQSIPPEDLLFLQDAACLARWNGDCDVLCLPEESFRALNVPAEPGAERGIRQALGGWARAQQVRFPFAEHVVSTLVETFPAEQSIEMLQRAYQAGLIEISGQGVLEFRHPLFASALQAEYLASFLGASSVRMEEIATFPGDLVAWSEPLALWAGLLVSPLATAEAFATWSREHPAQRAAALLVSLICLGVAATPPGVEQQQPSLLPPVLANSFGALLNDESACMELARLFSGCAGQGAPELYQALFPLLAIEGGDAFLRLLDPVKISDLFFSRLVDIIDEAEQEALVKRLVRALSVWEGAVVPRAAHLCAARSGYGGRLRTAAINVLGGTHDRGAVEPLMACLRDRDTFIARRAANALSRLGPNLILPRLLLELNGRTPADTKRPLPDLLLPILERFLNESERERQLQPVQFERILEALMNLLTTHTVPADLEKAQEILVRHGRLAAERDSGKLAIRKMVENLATTDDAVARKMTGTLKDVGSVATPQLLEQLEDSSSEAERIRILEVLASVRDRRALPALLRLLTDNSPMVQQTLAQTLSVYAPECISPLIDVVLHQASEQVAARAEQILGKLGAEVVEPVIAALLPLVPARTILLVHVLERVRDARTISALIALLRAAQTDVALTLAIISALGQFPDTRVVPPLITILNSSNPLLCEGAINALSNLGELACPELLEQLDVAEKTPLVARVERALLGMQPFPGDYLLSAVNECSDEQAEYIAEIFLARGADAAQLLAVNLFHKQARIRAWVRQAMSQVEGRNAVPALLEVLNRPDPAWRTLLASELLAHPQEAIPPLVGLLDDPERGDAAVSILLQAGRPVLPALIPALDTPDGIVSERASSILVTLVSRQPELLMDVIQLFGLGIPARARDALMLALTEDLAAISLPALLAGLEDAHLVPDVSATLVLLAQRSAAQCASVLDELLLALRMKTRRYGASLTLVELGALAVPGVGALITDDDSQVARSARQILGEIGTPAFSFLWAAHSDTSNSARREAAREVFRTMPTSVIKDELVLLLTSARQDEISMALALLLERIHDDALQAGRAGEMLPALLEYVQSASDERASLRILALLILLGGSSVSRALIDALYANPHHHELLTASFLLLGQGAESDLLAVLRDTDAPVQLQAEIAGILAMRAPDADLRERARSLSEHGLWAGRSTHNVTTVLQPSQLEVSLHALGGLLVGGHWNSAELQALRTASKNGSAEREIYDMLLGWRYSPQISRLEHELELEREERRLEMFAHTQELLTMKTQMIDLEHDLDLLKGEHEEQHRSHEEKSKELKDVIADLTAEKQALQVDLRQVLQEKQALAVSSQQATQEKERLQAEVQRWKTYSQQLEAAARQPKPGA